MRTKIFALFKNGNAKPAEPADPKNTIKCVQGQPSPDRGVLDYILIIYNII